MSSPSEPITPATIAVKKVINEAQSLQLRVAELERSLALKNYELNPVDTVTLEAATKAIATGDVATLHRFNIQHANAVDEHSGLLAKYGSQARSSFIVSIAVRLQAADDGMSIELLRAAKNALREVTAAEDNLILSNRARQLFVPRLSASYELRDEAIKCLNNSLLKNPMGRDNVLADSLQPFVDLLEVGAASNYEAFRVCSALMTLFSGPDKKNQDVGRLLTQNGVLGALVRRLGDVLSSEVLAPGDDKVLPGSLADTTYEGKCRGQFLVDALRLLYAVATLSSDALLQALMANEGVPPLQGEALAAADLHTPNIGVGDLYVFCVTRLLLAEADGHDDTVALDKAKAQVCALLLYAERAPGFIHFLQTHKVAKPMAALVDRAVDSKGHVHDTLLPVLAGLHSLLKDDSNLVDDFKILLLSNLLDELDVEDFDTEDAWKQALEKRHFQGHSRPGSTFNKLVTLLTSFDEHIKRFAGEIIWLLCDEDANVVTHHAGFGHAAHLLASKGGMLEQMLAGGGNA